MQPCMGDVRIDPSETESYRTAPRDRRRTPRRAERTRTAGAERASAGAPPTLDGCPNRRPRRSARRLPRPIYGPASRV